MNGQQSQSGPRPNPKIRITKICVMGSRVFNIGEVVDDLDAYDAGRLLSLGNAEVIEPATPSEAAPESEQTH